MIKQLFEYIAINRSGFFDPTYYLKEYEDVRFADIDPLLHFIKHGWKDGRNPSELFNTKYYLQQNPDVSESEINPLIHYIRFGKREGRLVIDSDQIKFRPDIPSKAGDIHEINREPSNITNKPVENHVEASSIINIEEYFQLHYQFTRFKQKPLIRIASWLDKFIPEKGWLDRLLHRLVSSLSIIKNKGVNEFAKEVTKYHPPITEIKVANEVSEVPPNDEYFSLSQDTEISLLKSNVDRVSHLPDIFILPIIDWEFRFQRPQQIATQLAEKGHRVFYIQASFHTGEYPLVKRYKKNIYFVRLQKEHGSIIYSSTLSASNLDQLEYSFRKLISAFNVHNAILFIDLPYWRQLAIRLKEIFGWKIIYDCMDFHAGFSNSSELTTIDEDLLLGQCDLVLVTSHFLLEKVQGSARNIILIPNGTEFDLFHQASRSIESSELHNMKKPIIGYYGAIADWFDTKLVGALARSHPEWTFALVGSTELADLKPFKGLDNILLFGEKPYLELPAYLSQFDVCIIPFKKIPLTEATNPVKLYEYLSAGKPIVATRLNEISHYSEYVQLAETQAEWEEKISDCLSESKSADLLTRRFNFASENTWKKRGEDVEQAIGQLFPKVSVVIITYNNLEYTKLCLESIRGFTDHPNYELVVVDNASIDGTLEYLNSIEGPWKDLIIISNNINKGFAAANNQGVAASTGDYIIFLNNDTIITPGWIFRLLQHLINDHSAGMVGPVTNSIGNEAKIDVDYTELKDINYFAARRALEYHGISFEIRVLAMFCCMISRSLFDEVGGMDERYQVGMFEDDDLAFKVRGAGFKIICAEDVFIHHFHGASFKKLTEKEYQRIFLENKKKFEKKWGMKWQPHEYRQK